MKEGWKIQRIGDICDVLDSKRKPITKSDRQSGDIPYYGATGIQDYVKDYIFDGRYLLVGEDGAKWGKDDKTAFIIEGKSWVNNHAHILKFHNDIFDSYVKYFLNGKDLNSYITGAVVPKLTQAALISIEIPVPSLEEQERIVAELDLLTGIIDKQKAQLKELDTLARSIFYDMFGDPVENEKGWEVKKLGKVLKTTSGGTPAKGHPEYYEDGIIPWVNSGDLHQMFIYDTPKHITQAGVDNSSAKFFPIDTCLIAMYGATVGEVSILKIQSTTNQAVCGIFPSKDYLPIFLYSTLKYSKNHFVDLASGGAQPNISQGIIKDYNLISPSTQLQELFVKKITTIESQKQSITRSIADTQKLFDYTMDKYFG